MNKIIMIVGVWGAGKSTLSKRLTDSWKGWQSRLHGSIGDYLISPDESTIFMGRIGIKNLGTDSVSKEFGRKIVEIAEVFDNKTIMLEGNKIYGKHIELYLKMGHEVNIIFLDYEYSDYIDRRIKRSGGTFKEYDTEKRRKNYDSKRKTYLNIYERYRYNENVSITRIDATQSEERIEETARSFLSKNPYSCL